MEAAYLKKAPTITDETEVPKHEKIYMDVNKEYVKVSKEVKIVIYSWKQPGTGASQLKPAIQIVQDMKLPDSLSSSASIERFCHWRKQYEAFMEQNKENFTKQGIKVARAFFDKAIDAKLLARLAMLRDDKGEKKITDATAITTILGYMQELYEDIN